MLDPNPRPARCRHCPVAPGTPCAGGAVRRFCELVDPSHVDHDPAYRDALQPPPASTSPRRGLGETLTLLKAMKSCPHRIERTDCGCGGLAACTLGKGRDGVVHAGDCFDCITTNFPLTARSEIQDKGPRDVL
jgi:hypothetical protein